MPPSPSERSILIIFCSGYALADDVQLNVLTEVFERTSYPTTEEREDLARKLGMTSRSVQIWVSARCLLHFAFSWDAIDAIGVDGQFQNRRRAVKVEQQSAIQRVEANDRVAEAKARGLPGPAYLVDAGQGGLMIGGGDVKREEKSQERGMTRPL